MAEAGGPDGSPDGGSEVSQVHEVSEAREVKAPRDIRRPLPLIGLAVAFWASLPQWSGPALNTEPSKEVADHTIPAIVLAIACLVALMVRRKSGDGPSLATFSAALVALLAGFWMVATHIPLVVQAFGGDAPWPGTIYHSAAAFAGMGFGLMWAVARWPDLAALEAEEEARKQASAG
jgi:hypothetical protein